MTDASLAPDLAAPAPQAVTDVAGHAVPLHYGDPAGEYATLQEGALVMDRSARMRLRLTGVRAAELFTGLVTNDVQALAPGHGCYAAVLTPKGKIVADVRVFARASGGAGVVDELLVDTSPRAGVGLMDVVRKFLNPRLAAYRDVSAELVDLGLFGAQARRVVAAAFGLGSPALAGLPPYGLLEAEADGEPVLVARVPDLLLEGFELLAAPTALPALWRRLLAAGARPGGLAAFEVARVEAGRPEWGVDMDDGTIPQEANLDDLHAISYTKGCYTGQETVARVHFRGHVNRHLRGLRFAGAIPDGPAMVADAEGKLVGDVRTSVLSPRLGPIGLAMIRREVEPGATVLTRSETGEVAAEVVALPFPT